LRASSKIVPTSTYFARAILTRLQPPPIEVSFENEPPVAPDQATKPEEQQRAEAIEKRKDEPRKDDTKLQRPEKKQEAGQNQIARDGRAHAVDRLRLPRRWITASRSSSTPMPIKRTTRRRISLPTKPTTSKRVGPAWRPPGVGFGFVLIVCGDLARPTPL